MRAIDPLIQILRFWQELNQTIVSVTHDLDEAVYLANRVVLMSSNPGRIKQIMDIPLPRPCDRMSPSLGEYRRAVFGAFELIHEESLEFAI